MELQLKNIGMIKEAIVKIDGLTVIAGENDTRKSTLGKALYLQLRFLLDLEKIQKNAKENKSLDIKEVKRASILPKLIFDEQINNGDINLIINNINHHFIIDNSDIYDKNNFKNKIENSIKLPIIIETPLVWNLNKFFNQMANIQSQAGMFGDELSIDYPFLLKDLHFRLTVGINKKSYHIEDKIFSIINGKFKKDELGNYYFEQKNKKISLLNTATGIKYFGIFQVLSQNNYLNEDTVLILDELEVHLHPKWQLELAKIIVELVKNGVKILVNSHSPYMIDALKYYADKEKINNNFYLTEKNRDETSNISNVTMDISPIFEKLTEPLRELRKMKLGLK